MHMRSRCACGSWKLHVYLIYTRDAGLEVEVEGEGLGDFRMPGLVDGTVVPGPLPSAFSRRAYMYSEA